MQNASGIQEERAMQCISGDGWRCSTSLFELSIVTFDREFKY